MSNKFDFTIIGAGIVGVATAYKLQLKFPKKRIAIIEKEAKIGCHQTGRNSGVIHSGIYYTPNSYKAKNCKNGRDQLVAFAEENNVPFNICGKVIVAVKEEELPLLEIIYQKGLQNGTPNICYLDKEQTKEKEPFIEAIRSIWVPSAGIINYVSVAQKMLDLIQEINPKSELFLNCRFDKIINDSGKEKEIKTSKGNFKTTKLIFCAGLHSDRTAKKSIKDLGMQIVGFRGDYYQLTQQAKSKIKSLVYPVPDPNFPFLGVHFTSMIDGSVECGPNAVFTFKREGYKTTSFNFKDTWQALTYKGTWKLFAKHWRKGLDEYKRAFSKQLFVKELQKMMPTLSLNDVQPARAGVRAQALDYHGNMVDDFKIEVKNEIVYVLNAPSPAATSCMAIADEIVSKVLAYKCNDDMKMNQGSCCYFES